MPSYWSGITMVRTVDDGMPGFFVLHTPRIDLSVTASQTHVINLFMKGLQQFLELLKHQCFDSPWSNLLFMVFARISELAGLEATKCWSSQ